MLIEFTLILVLAFCELSKVLEDTFLCNLIRMILISINVSTSGKIVNVCKMNEAYICN